MLVRSIVLGTIAIVTLFIDAIPAEATTFKFSYQFSSGRVLSGTFDGNLDTDGNTVGNVGNFSALYSGGDPIHLIKGQTSSSFSHTIGSQLFLNPSLASSTSGFVDFYGLVVPRDISYDDPKVNYGFHIYYDGTSSSHIFVGHLITSELSISYPVFFRHYHDISESELFNPAAWKVSEIPEQNAPPPVIPTPALLPGLLGMGVTVLRKRKNEQSEQVAETAEV